VAARREGREARRLLHSGAFQALYQGSNLALRAVYVVVFARVLGVELYGQYVYAQSWYLVATSASAWGMHEVLLARWEREQPSDRARLAGAGLTLRLLLALLATGVLVALVIGGEPDPELRLLVLVYAQGVIARGATGWIHALLMCRERSDLVLSAGLPVSLLEVALALTLALGGHGLLAIAVAQTACWWLGLGAAWLLYRSRCGALRPQWDRVRARAFLLQGPALALAAALLAWFGPGLLIALRYQLPDPVLLGEAALVIQVLAMLGQATRMIGNSALPFLTRGQGGGADRQAGFIASYWALCFYLGGLVTVTGRQFLPALVPTLLGEAFRGAAALLASHAWLLLPLALVQGLRLALIAGGRFRQFLLALLPGAACLATAIMLLGRQPTPSLAAALLALGVAYSTSALCMLAFLHRAGRAPSLAALLWPPSVLAAALIGQRFLLPASPLAATGVAAAILTAALCAAVAGAMLSSQRRAPDAQRKDIP
jgi:O-antigen/teichoic acid export membrane protein